MLSDFNKRSGSLTSDVIPNKGLSEQRVGRVSSRRGCSARTGSQVRMIYGLARLERAGEWVEELCRLGWGQQDESEKLVLKCLFAVLPVDSWCCGGGVVANKQAPNRCDCSNS